MLFPRGLDGQPGRTMHARWARHSELQDPAWQYDNGRFFLGYHPGDNAPLGRWDDRHIFLLAGSRAGKGVSVILPNACLWPGSLIAVDPKGELAQKTSRTRRRDLGQAVFVLDPFQRTGLAGHRYNPLDELVPARFRHAPQHRQDEIAIDNATTLADGLVVSTGSQDAHWVDTARFVLKGLILYAMTLPPAQRNLLSVRLLVTMTHAHCAPTQQHKKAGEALFQRLAECERFGGVVSSVGTYLLNTEEKERSSIMSSAVTQTNFLDSPALTNCLSGSDFMLADLKARPMTVYLCLPANRMETHARWLRVIVNMTLAALEDAPGKPEPPVLMCLDEFNVLGRMGSLAKAAGELAGFGVKLLTVLQDISQIKQLYGEWETFVGNAGLFLAFGNADASSLKYISDKLGTTSVSVNSSGYVSPEAVRAGASGMTTSEQVMPLLAPHEVARAFAREREKMLVMYPGMAPFWVRRAISYDDDNFRHRLDSADLDLGKSF